MSQKFNLEQLVSSGQLSPSGRDWLTVALDPFHDYQVNLEGYPDSNSGLSTVQMFTRTVTISKPAAAAGNWDSLVVAFPICSGGSAIPALAFQEGELQTAGNNIQYASTDGTEGLYPITIFSADAGEDLLPPITSVWAPTNYAVTGVNNQASTLSGNPGRMVAQGIEVHNTTSQLYRSGTVTVGRLSNNLGESFMNWFDTDTAVATVAVPTIFMSSPPAASSHAITMPNSRQWEAARGAYLINTLSSLSNPVERKKCCALFCNSSGNDSTAASGLSVCPKTATFLAGQEMQFNSMNSSYAYFTGLANESTLTVTVKSYFEYFPTTSDALAHTATPSAPFDHVALSMYAQAVNSLPPAVPVDFNPKGEWFKMVGTALSAALPKIGMSLESVMPGASVVTGTAKQILDKIMSGKGQPIDIERLRNVRMVSGQKYVARGQANKNKKKKKPAGQQFGAKL